MKDQVGRQREEARHTDVQCTQTTLTETTAGTAPVSQSAWQGYVEQEDACFRRLAAQEPCQNAMSTKLDSWGFGDHGAGKKVWDLGRDIRQPGRPRLYLEICNNACACEGRGEGVVCVFSLVTLSPVSQRGERDLAVGTCVSPVQRRC